MRGRAWGLCRARSCVSRMTDSRTRVYGRSPSSFEVKCPVPPILGSCPSVLLLTAATSGAQKWLILRSQAEKIASSARNVAFLRSRAEKIASSAQNVAFLRSRAEKIASPAQNVTFLRSRAEKIASPAQNVTFLRSRIAPFGTDDTVHPRFFARIGH